MGWTQQEIADVGGVAKQNLNRDFCNQFPDLENDTKKLLSEGHPHLDVAERYNMPLILTWAIDLEGRSDQQPARNSSA